MTIHGLAATLSLHGHRLDDEQMKEVRDTLERQAGRMATLVEQLLDLSRLDADAIPIEPERFNVKERLCEIVDTVAPDRPDDIRVSAPDDLETCADPAAVDRIVTNLVANALRYGAPPVSVTAV